MAQDPQTKIKELEAKIQQLRSTQVNELKEKIRAAKNTVAELEAELANINGKAPAAKKSERRKRTSSEEVKERILKALTGKPNGLSQKQISDASKLNYTTVVIFLKKNARLFKTTGKLKAKRFFLK